MTLGMHPLVELAIHNLVSNVKVRFNESISIGKNETEIIFTMCILL